MSVLAWSGVFGATALSAGEASFRTRAIWVSPPSFASASAADETLTRCRQAGLNLVLPNVMCYQSVAFKSPHFRGRSVKDGGFDPLDYFIRQAHALGIQVQPWCCVYYEGAGGRSGESLHPAWLNRSLDGRPFEKNFLSPSNPEVNPYLLSVLKDLLAYDLDGIHLDYIRYPGCAFDYSDAGRKAFKADRGFDPLDFLDHSDRIVAATEEPFQVRVLHPTSHADKVWELTATERTLDQAGIGFAHISERPELVEALRVPGLLIVSSFDDATPAMVHALASYVGRGGSLLWTGPPGATLSRSEELRNLLGVVGSHWLGQRRIALQAAADVGWVRSVAGESFFAEALSEVKPQGAKVLARLDSGEPVLTLNTVGKGRVLVVGFHLMKSTSPVVAATAREVVGWLRAEAGVGPADPLAAKREEWVRWRGERVTQLVRDLRIAARLAKPQVVLSSSGGPSPFEYFGCYRDAKRWLAEGLNEMLFPMNYTPDPVVLSDLLELQAKSAPAGKLSQIFPGLQLYDNRVIEGKKRNGPLPPDIVEKELMVLRQQRCPGFCLFSYDYLTDELAAVVGRLGGL